MSEVIYIKKYTRGKNDMRKTQKRMKYAINSFLDELLEEIIKKKKQDKEFDTTYIDDVANIVRYIIMGKDSAIPSPMPVIKTAEAFDIMVYETQDLDEEKSGNICINDNKYHENKIILVDEDEDSEHQRFVIAHELGHYLFDYIGSEEYYKEVKYECPYTKNNHKGIKEQNANRFAASLLMPEAMFIKEHNKAVDIDNRRTYVVKHLAHVFEVKESSIVKRIVEVGGE